MKQYPSTYTQENREARAWKEVSRYSEFSGEEEGGEPHSVGYASPSCAVEIDVVFKTPRGFTRNGRGDNNLIEQKENTLLVADAGASDCTTV